MQAQIRHRRGKAVLLKLHRFSAGCDGGEDGIHCVPLKPPEAKPKQNGK